ncbi:MAG: hypothetical protein J6Z36_02410, partial [Clostridia bacterium]|nr:hypothetical protein [Clostridia bacterium]
TNAQKEKTEKYGKSQKVFSVCELSDAGEVPDPYGRGEEVYRKTFDVLSSVTAQIAVYIEQGLYRK